MGWLPAVCRKMDIPYCIVKSKSRLGALVHQKTATALALTSVRSEDRHEFSQLVTATRQQYNENPRRSSARGAEASWVSSRRRPPRRRRRRSRRRWPRYNSGEDSDQELISKNQSGNTSALK